MITQLNNQMSDRTKALIWRVIDGDQRAVPLMYHIEGFYLCDRILEWLIDADITGKNLMAWYRVEHGGSILKMATFIVMKIKQDDALKPIYVGKDVKP